jgi:hypothetical protein
MAAAGGAEGVTLRVLIALACTAGALAYQQPLVPWHPDYATTLHDRPAYEAMAHGELTGHGPYSPRVGVPLLAGAAHRDGVPLWAAFLGIAVAGSIAAGLLVAQIVLETSGAEGNPIAVMLAFYASAALVIPQLTDFWTVDAASLALLLWGALCVVRWDRRGLLVAMVAGALVKETALLLVPLAYGWWARRLVDWRIARRVALLCAPGVAVLVALRLATGTGADALWYSVDLSREWYAGTDSARLAVHLLAGGGVLLPLAVIGARAQRDLIPRVAAFLVCVGAQLPFATSPERVLIYGAPALAILAGAVLLPQQEEDPCSRRC